MILFYGELQKKKKDIQHTCMSVISLIKLFCWLFYSSYSWWWYSVRVHCSTSETMFRRCQNVTTVKENGTHSGSTTRNRQYVQFMGDILLFWVRFRSKNYELLAIWPGRDRNNNNSHWNTKNHIWYRIFARWTRWRSLVFAIWSGIQVNIYCVHTPIT